MCRKTLAVFIIILFVPILIITATGWNLKSTILNPTFLTSELSENKIYANVISLASELLVNSLNKGQDNQESSGISADALKNSFKQNVSPDLLKGYVEQAINAAFRYIYGQDPTFQAVLDLKPAKVALNNALNGAVKESFATLPECESTQQPKDEQSQCRPKGMTEEDLQNQISGETGASQFTDTLPDSYDLGAQVQQFGPVLIIRQYISYFLIALYILSGISVLLLIFIALLIFKPLSSVFKWLATTFLVSGLLLASTGFLNLLVKVFVSGSTWNLPPDITTALNNLINSMSRDIIKNFLYLAGGLIILAIMFYVLAALLKPKGIKVTDIKPSLSEKVPTESSSPEKKNS